MFDVRVPYNQSKGDAKNRRMKFILDAQLPYTLKLLLRREGFDVVHTDDLPHRERTTDDEIRTISISDHRVVVTKDVDFLDSFYFKGVPQKLLLITTGNISNKDLFILVQNNLSNIEKMLGDFNFIELNNSEVIGHE